MSMYSFWRIFDNVKQKLRRRQREQIVALSGTGWPKHAKLDHPQHLEYCKRTLLVYMPCPGIKGTGYIVDGVATEYDNR